MSQAGPDREAPGREAAGRGGREAPGRLYIVSGLSGSGKTIALQALEDLGVYCIDNLPLALLRSLAAHLSGGGGPRPEHLQHAAVGIDARNLAEDFGGFPALVEALEAQGLRCQILFLTAQDEILLQRFSETRRKHPLSGPGVSLAEAIRQERRLLAPLAARADWVVDTSRTNVHQLRALVQARVGLEGEGLSLLFLSFGYKHGLPPDADYVFDLRCLPNPHWERRLRHLTGRDPEVAAFLEAQPAVQRMYRQLRDFLEAWVPCFQGERRSYLTVALGCTGGQHRSVYLAERLARHFARRRGELGAQVLVRHRELD